MRTVTWELAGQASACMDRLCALSSRRGTTGCRQRGKCSVCNNIHMFRWLVLWLLSHCWRYFGGKSCDVISVWIPPELTCFSLTAALSAVVNLPFDLRPDSHGRLCSVRLQFWPQSQLQFFSITLPKTPAIQHAKLKNKSNWCSCKIWC